MHNCAYLTGDSTIHIDRSLEYTAQINPPEPWRYAYSSQKQEATVAGKAVTVAIYAKDLYDQALDTALKAEIERLERKR